MRIPVILTSMLLALAAYSPTIASAQGRLVSCKLYVDGNQYISGKCRFSPIGRDGSFQIKAGNGKYFAQVHVSVPGVGIGYWNGEPYANHAHNDLGELMREDACWVNERASVCAW